jgi:hypothetical protein
MCKTKSEFFETDSVEITFEKLAQAPPGEVLVVQPYRLSREQPIQIDLPRYDLPDPKLRERLGKELVAWRPVRYEDLLKTPP